jgi:myo-inositol 2-dehydrogenase/D-chiro-inositol 1-dehydrogenase
MTHSGCDRQTAKKTVFPVSRREFLHRGTIVASTATIGPSLLSVSRLAHAAGKAEIKLGMIGCGGRCSGAAAQALSTGPDVKLVALTDIFENRARAALANLRERYPEQVLVDNDHVFVGFDGYKKVIECSDAVLIACASKFHPMYMEAAIQAGRHVFVEKPHGIDPVGARRTQAACDLAKEKGVSAISGLQSRFDFGFQETIKRIHDGAIGDVVAIQAMFLRGPYGLVQRDPKLTETQYQFSNWYHFCWLSGDDVTQSLVHNLDRVAWILHEQTPLWCFGLGGRSASFGEVYGDMFDHHTVVYEYPGGVRVYALCRTQVNTYGHYNDLIMGTKGQCNLFAYRIEGETKWQYSGPRNDAHLEVQKVFMDSIRKGEPINSGYHMAKSTMVAVMGQLACYLGKELTYEQVSQSNFQFGPPPDESSFDTPPPVVPDETGNYLIPKPGITKFNI